MAAEQDALRRKNEEISQAYREKSRKLLQTQELYDKVKRKAEMGHIQRAASDAVDSTLQASSQANLFNGSLHDQEFADIASIQTFGQSHRIDLAGMNTGLPRSNFTMPGEDSHWPRPVGTGRCRSIVPFLQCWWINTSSGIFRHTHDRISSSEDRRAVVAWNLKSTWLGGYTGTKFERSKTKLDWKHFGLCQQPWRFGWCWTNFGVKGQSTNQPASS